MKKIRQSLSFILLLLFVGGCQTEDKDSSKSSKDIKQVVQEEDESNEDIKTTSSSTQIT